MELKDQENYYIHETSISKAPINLALIKYWGKKDEKEVLPLNDSLSVTLDMKKMYTETKIDFKIRYKNTQNTNNKESHNNLTYNLLLNNKEFALNKRQKELLNSIYTKYFSNEFVEINISSTNSFPTGAGCASSASGGAAFSVCLKDVLIKVLKRKLLLKENIKDDEKNNITKAIEEISSIDLSSIARKLSGSASRSVFGGFVEWSTSGISRVYKDENYWKDIRMLLLVISNKTKDYSSTDGMKYSKETSEFLKYRIENLFPQRMISIKEIIDKKDFEELCLITMKESNSLHAVCRDTYPSLNYLNETSQFVINNVNILNDLYGENKKENIICGYSFDAGPNAWVLTNSSNMEKIKKYFELVLNNNNDMDYDKRLESVRNLGLNIDMKLVEKSIKDQILNNYFVEEIIDFELGKGAYIQ